MSTVVASKNLKLLTRTQESPLPARNIVVAFHFTLAGIVLVWRLKPAKARCIIFG